MAKGEKAKVSDAEKQKKFEELSRARMNRILKGIASLAKLSAKSRYHYTPAHIEKLKRAFQVALEQCFAQYAGQVKTKEGFEY